MNIVKHYSNFTDSSVRMWVKGVKGKPDIIDIIEKKIQQWYGHVKRMPEERISKLIMEWIPEERRKRRRPRKTRM
jgi:hypothetical protein